MQKFLAHGVMEEAPAGTYIRFRDHQAETARLHRRMEIMYAALVGSGSIVRVPEAHDWIDEIKGKS